ncbi:uncharacterized protein LOC127121846 [Lathyrus oleraceus]|uniref:uncharacterized protein LOC127121846 n=1 Tax=Pisum sativum TaxID=3888 RepID=UPI0021D2CEFA|nr:uncharacterized protein LOC127121846 [Pisum sativum]
MEFPDEDVLEVTPLCVIPGDAPGPSSIAGSKQGNIPDKPPHQNGMHYTGRAIRNLVTRILNEGHSIKGKNIPSKKPVDNSHEPVENVVNLEEESSEEEDDTLVRHVKPSAAKKLKTRKGKIVAKMMTAKTRKKTAGVGPSKSWSKVEARKRKVRDSSDSEEDVEDDVPYITPAKKQAVKKSPGKAAAVHLDKISFHLEDGAAKWKFVIQRRVAVERELGKEAVEVKEVMELIKEQQRIIQGVCKR